MPINNVLSSGNNMIIIPTRLMALGGFALIALTALIGGAFAQELPPLQAAGAAITPSSNDPCPLPSAEMSRTPDDLGKIQADIDRYTLCMERAQLLQRLNDLATENQNKLNQSNGISATNPGMQLGGLPDFAKQKEQLKESVSAAAVGETSSASAAAPAAPAASEWTIMKILGSGGGLSAQLGKSDGVLARVQAGETLPDGARVLEVTATSVDISQDGETKSLRWNEGSNSSKIGGRF